MRIKVNSFFIFIVLVFSFLGTQNVSATNKFTYTIGITHMQMLYDSELGTPELYLYRSDGVLTYVGG